MKILRRALILCVLALLAAGAFAWVMPAGLAYRYGASQLGPIVLSGLRGTVWNGHADGVSVLGRDLGELDWRAQKWPLLRGRFVADVRIKGAEFDAAGLVTRGRGLLAVQDFRFSLPAAVLAPALAPGVHPLGTISGVIEQASLAHASLTGAAGSARWSEAGVDGPDAVRFSDLIAEFAAQPDGSLAGTLRDDGQGALALAGRFSLSFGAFDLEATLRARRDDAQTAELLRQLGEVQPDGSVHVALHERLLKP